MYDSRLGRWLSVDPLAEKFVNQSPYNFVINNPLLIVDPDGMDTLVVHAMMLDPKTNPELTTSSGIQHTVAFQLTFSLIRNKEEIPIKPQTKNGESTFYMVVPLSQFQKGNNATYIEGKEEWVPIRFENYISNNSGTEYFNAIRLKYVDKKGRRILSHLGYGSSSSSGCHVPTCELTEKSWKNLPDSHKWYIKASESQEILDMIRDLHDEYIPSNWEKDGFQRNALTPEEGYDFMWKTNSTAPSRRSMKPIQPVSKDLRPEDPVLTPDSGNE